MNTFEPPGSRDIGAPAFIAFVAFAGTFAGKLGAIGSVFLGRFGETVAGPSHGFDRVSLPFTHENPAQPADVRINRAVIDLWTRSPNCFQEPNA